MEAENRTQTAGPRDRDIWTTKGELATKYVVTRDLPRDERRERKLSGAKRFGPMPGEIYPDEAHFGSFS